MTGTGEPDLTSPYTEAEREEPDAGTRLARRLGVYNVALTELEAAIYRDLDVDRGGVGWWAHDDPTKLRALVGDYLFQAVMSIQRNFVEAAIHRVRGIDAWRRESDLVRRGTFDSRANDIFPVPRNPGDDLPGPEADAHAAGFFRAVGSAFDCLAVCVVCIAPLPMSPRSITWTRLLKGVEDDLHRARGSSDLRRTLEAVVRLLDESGPVDWLKWTLAIRNMLVHHPRRVNARFVLPAGREIALPNGKVHQPAKVVALFQRQPSLSEVEEWFAAGSAIDIVLPEPAEETVTGILDHALRLHGEVAGVLTQVWERRRAWPRSNPQPLSEQWRGSAERGGQLFKGFSPRDLTTASMRNFETSIVDGRRIEAARVLMEEDGP